jgi:hypothetical protein
MTVPIRIARAALNIRKRNDFMVTPILSGLSGALRTLIETRVGGKKW